MKTKVGERAVKYGNNFFNSVNHIAFFKKTTTTEACLLYKDAELKEYSLQIGSTVGKVERGERIPYPCDQIFCSPIESIHSCKRTW